MKMEKHNSLSLLVVSLLIFIFLNHSHASQTQPISENHKLNQLSNTTQQLWTPQTQPQKTQFKLTSPSTLIVSGALCFMAASISSAGGLGGGGLFIPILTIVANLELKTASAFSAFMVTGGSIANVLFNMFITSRIKKFDGQTLIGYDIALLSEPFMVVGVSIGVICNIVFSEQMITIVFATFLGWSTFKTCSAGVTRWKKESEEKGNLEIGLVGRKIWDGNEGGNVIKESPLGGEGNLKLGIPWRKIWVLVVIWLSFVALYILRGNRYGQIIKFIKPCGIVYWILCALQIPLAIIFTAWILFREGSLQDQTSNQKEQGVRTRDGPSNKLIFPGMALLAGIFGGLFGSGGGMLLSPLLLQVGIAPEVTAATSSVMVLISFTMSAIQYLLLGMDHTDIVLLFAIPCFVASIVGLMVIKSAIDKHGRASLIVFSVGTVMALSAILMTSYGALAAYRDYKSGREEIWDSKSLAENKFVHGLS